MKEKALGLGHLDAPSLSYSGNLFSSRAHPWSSFMGKAVEVSGKGLRRIKIALASEWKPKPCQGSFQTIFPVAGPSREPELQDGFLKNDASPISRPHKASPGREPRQAGSWADHNASFLAQRPCLPAHSSTKSPRFPHPPRRAVPAGGEGLGVVVVGTDSPSSPLGSRWRSPPPSGRGPLSPWPGS